MPGIPNGTFRTADIVLASWLICNGASLVGIDDADPRRVKFLIRPHPTPNDLAVFTAGDVLAPVHSFYGALRQCKRVLAGGAR